MGREWGFMGSTRSLAFAVVGVSIGLLGVSMGLLGVTYATGGSNTGPWAGFGFIVALLGVAVSTIAALQITG